MTFGFASPWLLLLLLLVPLSVLAPRLWRSRSKPAGLRYASTELTSVRSRSWRLGARPVLQVLRLLALALVIVALARPQLGETEEVVRGEGVDIAFALDISGSMGSLDFVEQNRLEVSKEVIGEFIARRQYDRIGLVVFASSAFVQSPSTIDQAVLMRLLKDVELAPKLGVKDGTAIGLGMMTAASMLKDSDVESKVIVLLTDGVNNSGEIDPMTAASVAEALGIRVYTIGAGRPGVVPRSLQGFRGNRTFYRDSDLDEDTLKGIASATGGLYFNATDALGLRDIYDEINALEKSEVEILSFSRHQELAGWLMLPVLILLPLELTLRNTLLRKIP